METKNIIAAALILCGGAIGVPWWQSSKALRDAKERKELAVTKLTGAQRKLELLDTQLEEVQQQWAKAEAVEGASASLESLTKEAEAGRAEWKKVRDEFELKLQTARKELIGRQIPSIRLKSGLVLEQCAFKEIANDGASIEHSGGIARAKPGDLPEPFAGRLLLGWNPQLPASLQVPEEIADLPIFDEESPGGLTGPAIDKMSETDRLARMELIRARLAWLAPQIKEHEGEIKRQDRNISMIMGRYEAARILGHSRQFGLREKIAGSQKEIFNKKAAVAKAKTESRFLQRELDRLSKAVPPGRA